MVALALDLAVLSTELRAVSADPDCCIVQDVMF